MRLRRWHRLGIVLTLIGGIGLFWVVFTRDDELGELMHYRQVTECRVAERRGLPAEKCFREVEARRAALLRDKAGQAGLVTAAAIVAAWGAAFASLGLYRWIMAGTAPPVPAAPPPPAETAGAADTPAAPAPTPDAKAGRDRRRRRRERVEPRLESRPER